ncbi:MAG: hypothetical protein U9O78_03750, partial [Patescibacteria group bacterium]|nr:hypothetical protein [Patescibacteria group bacterium]
MKNMNEISENIKRLTHFVQLSATQNLPRDVIAFFIEQILYLAFGKLYSIANIQKGVKKAFDLTFTTEELELSVDFLVSKKRVIKSTDNNYSLEKGRAKQISDLVESENRREVKIYEEWINQVGKRNPALKRGELDLLLEDLKVYVNKFFVRHGAECATFLYDGLKKEKDVEISLSRNSAFFGELPKRGVKLDELRKIEFPLFFLESSAERKLFLSGLLDATFVYHVVSVDENCAALLRKEYKGIKIYLDTNIIYCLIGLNGKNQKSLIRRVLHYAHNFGMKIVVTQRTIDEFRKSIKLVE